MTDPAETDYEAVRSFAARWARGTLGQAERFREAREWARRRDWQHERLEDWSPSWDEVVAAAEDVWVQAHLLVVAAHQLQSWTRKLGSAGGPTVPAGPDLLKALRNAVEHLDEAVLGNEAAHPDPSVRRGKWALDLLPGGVLPLDADIFATEIRAFDLVKVDEVEAVAWAALAAIEDEILAPQLDAYRQFLEDERRGK